MPTTTHKIEKTSDDFDLEEMRIDTCSEHLRSNITSEKYLPTQSTHPLGRLIYYNHLKTSEVAKGNPIKEKMTNNEGRLSLTSSTSS